LRGAFKRKKSELDQPVDGLGTVVASACFRDGFDLIAQLFGKAQGGRLVFLLCSAVVDAGGRRLSVT